MTTFSRMISIYRPGRFLRWRGPAMFLPLFSLRSEPIACSLRRRPLPVGVSSKPWSEAMSTDGVAVIGFLVLFALMLLRVPVGMAMGLVGVSGFGYLVGGAPGLKLVGQTSMRTVTDYTFGIIPMFLLMGAFVSRSGMSRELFQAANRFVGHLRGGLGIATIAACAGF